MTVLNIPVATLEELGLPWGNYLADWRGEEHRWYTRRHVVFQYLGKYWRVEYMSPATEMQEGQDIWDSDPVVAHEVEQVTVERQWWKDKQ